MAEVATRIVGPGLLSASAATKYTATAKAVIRHIHVFNNSATAATFTLSIGTDAAGTRLYDAMSIDPHKSFDWSGFLVLNNTEIIQAFSGTASVLNLTVDAIVGVP